MITPLYVDILCDYTVMKIILYHCVFALCLPNFDSHRVAGNLVDILKPPFMASKILILLWAIFPLIILDLTCIMLAVGQASRLKIQLQTQSSHTNKRDVKVEIRTLEPSPTALGMEFAMEPAILL